MVLSQLLRRTGLGAGVSKKPGLEKKQPPQPFQTFVHLAKPFDLFALLHHLNPSSRLNRFFLGLLSLVSVLRFLLTQDLQVAAAAVARLRFGSGALGGPRVVSGFGSVRFGGCPFLCLLFLWFYSGVPEKRHI